MLEVIVPGGLFFLFFGFGAILTGILVSLGVLSADWAQWLTFALFSAALLVLLRAKVSKLRVPVSGATGPDIDGLVGVAGTALSEINTEQLGQIEVRGAQWNARNVGTVNISAGQRCVVERVEGLVLFVRVE
jgi:membrane protein implicated in regulation of membrane protease activity